MPISADKCGDVGMFVNDEVHERRKRLQLGLTQKHVAKLLGVTEFSVLNWETNAHQAGDAPLLRRVIEFLGYDPDPTGTTIPDLLRAKCRKLGWGQWLPDTLSRLLPFKPWTAAAEFNSCKHDADSIR